MNPSVSSLRWRRAAVVLLVAVTVPLGVLAPAALADPPPAAAPAPAGPLVTVATFDPARGELAENLAVDLDRSVWVTLANAGTVRRIAADGRSRDYPVPTAGGNVTGIAFDAKRRPHVAVASPDPALAGVWRLDAPDGRFTRVVALPTGRFGDPSGALPNGIAFDRRGTLYVAESYQGRIFSWRPGQHEAAVWAQSSALAPDPANVVGGLLLPAANGIKVYRDTVYVSNPNKATVLAATIRRDGSPGRFVERYRDVRVDDFAFDVAGDLYATTILTGTVERISPDGRRTVLATPADGLDGPSAVAFGRGGDGRPTAAGLAARFSLFVTNVAVVSPDPRPSLQRLQVQLPGAPLAS